MNSGRPRRAEVMRDIADLSGRVDDLRNAFASQPAQPSSPTPQAHSQTPPPRHDAIEVEEPYVVETEEVETEYDDGGIDLPLSVRSLSQLSVPQTLTIAQRFNLFSRLCVYTIALFAWMALLKWGSGSFAKPLVDALYHITASPLTMGMAGLLLLMRHPSRYFIYLGLQAVVCHELARGALEFMYGWVFSANCR